ncbi:M48 family metallopeptidase [Chitinophaga pinensis]|uniref:Peptidase M48 Ste24p n=1 Tax=Chitinophaga pinensis (strain ATCC 43595 / DSM 2588 / LMG 13176 / NBRC 15968 / NCIMB 11800 / UQM 2034) TaxID=485918 RepID=A0A979G8G4_CHIPD|nr:M48 family metallopeptidase [Chitinophaga pinensis]ACU62656.1 peptidase M48 Ste24p [Chitinophaga pinensis DSM 2588]
MFKGTFYDHKVAVAIPATIRIFDESLQFETPVEGMPPRRHHWLFSEINVDMADKRFIRLVNQADDAGTLEVNDAAFVDMFLEKYKRVRSIGLDRLVLRNGVKVGLAALLIILGLAALAHFVILPWCADRIVDRLPRSFDKELGETAMQSMDESRDVNASALLTRFGAQMHWDSPDSLKFFIVPSKIENAYALPGGYVFVYTGLLKKLNKKEELAALLSHEVAHVSCRHSVRKLCRDMSSSVLLTLVLTNSSQAASVFYSNANALYNLTYSRQYEQQADIVGMETLRKNHIDQHGMVELMQVLQQLSEKVDVPEFISTHPLTKNRISYAKENIRKHPGTVDPHEQMDVIFGQLKALYKK